MKGTTGLIGRTGFLGFLVLLLVGFIVGVAAAQDAPDDDSIDRTIADGRLVYEANCVACHGDDGSGLPGTFPPLVDNPSIQDTEYLNDVIRNGLSGEIDVGGQPYDGVMPGFPGLDDAQVDSLIVYLQQGLGAVPAPAPPPEAGGGEEDSGSSGSSLAYRLVALVVLVGVAVAAWPLVRARSQNGTFTTAQSWLKSGAIVLYFIVATVFIPSRVVEAGFLATAPSFLDSLSADQWDIIRSLIGSGVWVVALGLGVWGLRRLQRGKVI
ncbi:MAG: c-type cytochrome [Acidimicrobiia bacterium]